MNSFNFKSQPCTSREQSEKLLSLGLKKETADMHYQYYGGLLKIGPIEGINDIPAWSLGILIEMMPKTIGRYFQYTSNDSCGYMDEDALNMNGGFDEGNIYDSIISCIEWLIKEGNFPKEYLV